MAETAEQRSNRRIDEVLEDLTTGCMPRWKLTKREAGALIGDFTLQKGDGELASESLRGQSLCVMQTANVYHSVLAQIGIDGSPSYTEVDQVDPLIEAYMVVLNDALKDDDRQRLMTFIPRLLNTRITEKTERRATILRAIYGEYTWKWFSALEDRLRYPDFLESIIEECLGEDDKTWEEAIPKIKKSQWLRAVNSVLDLTDWYDEGSFMEALINREGVEASFKIAERLLRAR